MTYLSNELSVQSGSPVFLLLFTRGTKEWRYTAAAYHVTALGHTWAPTPVKPGSVTQSNDMAKDTLSLKFPRGHEFASTFLGYSPDQITSVTLYRGHIGDGEFVVYWKGRVSSFRASGDELSLECEPIFTSLKRPGLRARYQRTCRHALYHRGCSLNAEDWATDGLCLTADGVNIVVPEAASLPVGWLVGGMLKAPDGVLRYILNHNGANLTLIRPLPSLEQAVADAGYGVNYGGQYGGAAVRLYPGCDHSLDTCSSKFDNSDNFGGFPWIPSRNPYSGSSIA